MSDFKSTKFTDSLFRQLEDIPGIAAELKNLYRARVNSCIKFEEKIKNLQAEINNKDHIILLLKKKIKNRENSQAHSDTCFVCGTNEFLCGHNGNNPTEIA